MKCPYCGKQMKRGGGPAETYSCPCGAHAGIDRGSPLMDKPVDAQNQVRNITDEVDPDLHRKPVK